MSGPTAGHPHSLCADSTANACRAGNTEADLRLYQEAISHSLVLPRPPEPGPGLDRFRPIPSRANGSCACCCGISRVLRRRRSASETCCAITSVIQRRWKPSGFASNMRRPIPTPGTTSACLGKLLATSGSRHGQCYRQALSIDAGFKPSRQNLAQALVQKKCHDEALVEFERSASSQHPQRGGAGGGAPGAVGLPDGAGSLQMAQARRWMQRDRGAVDDAPARVTRAGINDEQVSEVRQRWSDDAKELLELLDGYYPRG